ncbi:MAG: hypothetical protein AAF682_02320 [Planctomycetota bacterium]
MVVSLAAALPLLLTPAPPQSVFDHVSTIEPAGALASHVAPNGEVLFQALGTSVVRLDLDAIRACETGAPTTPCDPDGVLLGTSAKLDAAVFKIVPVSNTAYLACGGDYGLYGVVNDNVVHIDPENLDGRWCLDAEVTPDGLLMYVLFAGFDSSELRVYTLPPLGTEITLWQTIELSSTNPMPPTDPAIRPGTAYAIELRGLDAYIANGRGGLVKVSPYIDKVGNLQWDVDQGPPLDPGAIGCIHPGDCFAESRVRDLKIAGDYLYAAADSQGLIEVDLTIPWDANMPAEFVAPVNPDGIPCCMGTPTHYGRRVDAIEDPEVPGRIVVALGTISRATIFEEGGPYQSYGGFGWELSLSNLPQAMSPLGCENHLFVFERDAGGPPPAQSLHMRVTTPDSSSCPAPPTDRGLVSWESIDLHYADGRYWVYDEAANTWNFERVAGTLQNLTSNGVDFSYADYIAKHPSTTLGVVSPTNPHLILFGQDGGQGLSLGLSEIIPSQDPEVVEIAGTTADPDQHRLGLYVDAWPDAGGTLDWCVSSFALPITDKLWKISRFDPFDVLGNWDWWVIQYPFDDLHPPGDQARGYAPVAVDTSSNIVALGRTFTRQAVALYDRDAVMALADTQASETLLDIDPVVQLDVHPELTPPEDDWKGLHCLGLKFFDLGTKRVLGVAAGPSKGTATFNLPKWVFYDLGDVSEFGTPAWTGPDAVEQIFGPVGPAMASGFNVVTLGARQYCIANETSGRVHLYDLTDLFGSGAVLVDTYDLPTNKYDGLREVSLEVEVDPDGAGPGVPLAYVAMTRGGILRLAFDQSAVPATFDEAATDVINTPGQATGLHLFEDGGGVKRLVVGDHEFLGLRVYRDTE